MQTTIEEDEEAKAQAHTKSHENAGEGHRVLCCCSAVALLLLCCPLQSWIIIIILLLLHIPHNSGPLTGDGAETFIGTHDKNHVVIKLLRFSCPIPECTLLGTP